MTGINALSVGDIFSALSSTDEAVLVSLPYRIGLYVSYADVTGGWEAQDREQQSLANILRQYSEDFCKTEFCQKLLMETLMRRDQWPAWSQNIDSVPQEAEKVADILSGIFKEKDLRAFKEVLVDVALSVAMAFHEGRDGHYEPKTEISAGFFGFFKKGSSKDNAFDHMHISHAERAALKRICVAMKYEAHRD
jgi:hypothetical protein